MEDEKVVIKCQVCQTSLWHWPHVKAPLFCSNCGHLVWSPGDAWGPGNRPAPDDKRIFGTDEEKEDAAELGSEQSAPPSPERAKKGGSIYDEIEAEELAARAAAVEELNRRMREAAEQEPAEDEPRPEA